MFLIAMRQAYPLLSAIIVTGNYSPFHVSNFAQAMRKLVETIGPPRMTFYGDITEMTNKSLEEMEHKDTAWSNTALPAHNDGTYFYDSPG